MGPVFVYFSPDETLPIEKISSEFLSDRRLRVRQALRSLRELCPGLIVIYSKLLHKVRCGTTTVLNVGSQSAYSRANIPRRLRIHAVGWLSTFLQTRLRSKKKSPTCSQSTAPGSRAAMSVSLPVIFITLLKNGEHKMNIF